MASVILGDWTHRRGDAGGARAVAAEIDRPRPAVAWSWQPEHGGRVDQVRVTGTTVIVATMMPRDPHAARWEHAVVYALDADTGAEIARRLLPDPVPVAAVVVQGGIVHVISTQRGEPIFWYALNAADLVPAHRRAVAIADGLQHDDVLDAWATPDGGLWLELDATAEGRSERLRGYAFADPDGGLATAHVNAGLSHADGSSVAQDACAGAHELFVPAEGAWGGRGGSTPPGICRLDRTMSRDASEPTWVRATVVGPRSKVHTLESDGVVCAVAVAEDSAKPDHARVEIFAVDRGTGALRWRARDDRLAIKTHVGRGARAARRPNGEVLFQSLDWDGAPCTSLLCARPDGRLDSIMLGARGRYVLDASLGDLALAHRENKDGRVELVGFAIDHEGRLLGRRAVPRWTIDVGEMGGATTVYAGAGAVVVRGARSVAAIRM
jgi:hypothetical protein